MQLVPDDAVTEALESDNLALQNMNGSKYVQVYCSGKRSDHRAFGSNSREV